MKVEELSDESLVNHYNEMSSKLTRLDKAAISSVVMEYFTQLTKEALTEMRSRGLLDKK